MKKYILENTLGEYWHKDFGWTIHEEEATSFTKAETEEMYKPMPEASTWIYIEENEND